MRKIVFILSALFCLSASALVFPLPPKGEDLVGRVQYLTSQEGDSLADLGMAFDAGRDAMRIWNPIFDPDKPLPVGVPVVVPTLYLLPDHKRIGIIVNISEMRLYYFPPGRDVVYTYPIGIGKPGHMTPLGETYVTHKKRDPIWIPPKSIRDYNRKRGIILPKVISGGPDNPLGRRAIYLGFPSYLIHATNFPQSIGSRGSFGCMRMMETDINHLFPNIAPKTRVLIVEEPYKAGWANGKLYLEIHKPLVENEFKLHKIMQPVLETLLRLSVQHNVKIDWYKVDMAFKNQLGVPTMVSESKNSEHVLAGASEVKHDAK